MRRWEEYVAFLGVLAACAAAWAASDHASNVAQRREESMAKQYRLCSALYANGSPKFTQCIHADHYPKGVK